jgi:CHAT domain-containing protein/tetratricopeptide (TPR) repeat protein
MCYRVGSSRPFALCCLNGLLGFLAFAAGGDFALAQTHAFIAPPRTIADITAILDQEKRNSAPFAKNKAAADGQPPHSATPAALYKFYLNRGRARAELGRFREGAEDGSRAAKVAQGNLDYRNGIDARLFIALQHLNAGEFKIARDLLSALERDVTNAGDSIKGLLIGIYRWTVSALIGLGNLEQAEGYLRRLRTLRAETRNWNNDNAYGSAREAELETRADLAMARGLYRDAENAYRRSIALAQDAILKLPRLPSSTYVTKEILENRIDAEISLQAHAKANQGRLAEAEADIRRALLSRLRANGRYAINTANQVSSLGYVISLQGRYAEAQQLVQAELEIKKTVGVAHHSEGIVGVLRRLSSLASLQGHHEAATEIDAEIDASIQSWEPQRRQRYEFDNSRVYSLLHTGRTVEGIAAAQRLVAREVATLGENHVAVALARGLLAIGYGKVGRISEALAEFKRSVPVLISAPRDTDVDESAVSALLNARIRDVIEGYVEVLAKAPSGTEPDSATEAFRLIDAVRGRSVQQAVAASAARMVTTDKALAELVRRDQDQEMQINAQIGVLNNVLALPPGEREDAAVRRLNTEIEALRTQRTVTRAEIARRFPKHAALMEPRPPSIEEVRAVLRTGEALVSFYFGREKSFAWAFSKGGPIAFAVIEAGSAEIETKIVALRTALEADIDTIEAMPAFDLAVASDLYEQLLKPVEPGWRQARSLIVVTNGALALLPLGLLPRERTVLKDATEPLFAGYREVPWLARTHAITLVPSAAALKTLRQLPLGSASRETLIAYGDPYFSESQAAEAAREDAAAEASLSLRRRATPKTSTFDSADLARLPRLPDTGAELRSIARALRVDPARALHLGKAANTQAVKAADLSRYRIIAFATHGLLPGDLNGLTQPALALTAPQVAGVGGDGLLRMEEILALKLDADWVILSACNTGAGTSSGAEALSGLGRSFFYAGARSLLITNWSVYSVAARELVEDLFKRQAIEPSLSRSEALRQAMMALVDNGGYSKDGATLYTYAHPVFWAPYSIIGESHGN